MSPRTKLAALAGTAALVTPGLVAASTADATPTARSGAESTCQVVRFDTSDSQFRPGLDNQGSVQRWPGLVSHPFSYVNMPQSGAASDTYWVGYNADRTNPVWNRNYFTFDLSSLPEGTVTKAVLVVRNGVIPVQLREKGPGATLRMRQVVTPARSLNLQTADPKAVYDDLGRGPVYAARFITEAMELKPVIRVPLNDTGLGAVAAAAGRYFSLGGRLDNTKVDPWPWSDNIWFLDMPNFPEYGYTSGKGLQRLNVTVCQ